MQSTHRKYPAAKNSTQYLTIRQTTHLRADLLHFPGPKKLPKLVAPLQKNLVPGSIGLEPNKVLPLPTISYLS
jgi:hypothetical protein